MNQPPPIPKLKTLLWRGCRKKCPQCGEGPLYEGWIKIRDHCPVCGLVYLPNQGDLWGPLLFVDRALFIIPLIVVVYLWRWQPGVWSFLVFGGAVIFVLVYTLPHRNGMSLAVDYLIRRNSGDLVERESPDENDPPATG